jgi:PTH1 family peptidyl-tRNA hydrolase
MIRSSLPKRLKSSEKEGKIMYIIAGLGNPDKKYEKTRHNVGFDVIDVLAEKYHIEVKEKKHRALCGSGWIGGRKVLLLKPQTYMNLSGESIQEALSFYKLDPETELLVIYDDISLAPGRIRVRAKGSAGGHNGIKNIIAMTGTQGFARIKVGVGEKPEGWDLVDYVLGRFSAEDRKLVEEAFNDAVSAAERILEDDLSGAMNEFNGKK